MSTKSNCNLLNFGIFNSTCGLIEEQEYDKILFYFPLDVTQDVQLKTIGLCDAIVKFTTTFTDKDCQVMRTEKTLQVLYQPEKDYWMFMTVSIPFTVKTGKDGLPYNDYYPDNSNELIYQTLLNQSYKMFKLFNSNFNDIVQNSDFSGLKQKLLSFFSKYVPTIPAQKPDLLNVFNGISFLPLNKQCFLQVLSLINHTKPQFSRIVNELFLYNDQLVWSSLNGNDTQILYQYLVTNLLPAHQEVEMQVGFANLKPSLAMQGASSTGFTIQHFGKFVTSSNENDSAMMKAPRIFVTGPCGENQEFFLIVYKALSASLCLLADASLPLSSEFYEQLDIHLGQQTTQLASQIADFYLKRPLVGNSCEIQPRYFYFNRMNLAVKDTVHSEEKNTGAVHLPQYTLKMMADASSDIKEFGSPAEIFMKTTNDTWVVVKSAEERELYVSVPLKNATLIEINDEVKKLCVTQFSNIFMTD